MARRSLVDRIMSWKIIRQSEEREREGEREREREREREGKEQIQLFLLSFLFSSRLAQELRRSTRA